MLHNPKRSFQPARAVVSAAAEARRLRLEYNRLQRRIEALSARGAADAESEALSLQIERVARELGLIRADSVHAVESKLKVALDLIGDGVDGPSHKLLSSALADLHYLALLSDPSPADEGARANARAASRSAVG
jgi:hypothetical protein